MLAQIYVLGQEHRGGRSMYLFPSPQGGQEATGMDQGKLEPARKILLTSNFI